MYLLFSSTMLIKDSKLGLAQLTDLVVVQRATQSIVIHDQHLVHIFTDSWVVAHRLFGWASDSRAIFTFKIIPFLVPQFGGTLPRYQSQLRLCVFQQIQMLPHQRHFNARQIHLPESRSPPVKGSKPPTFPQQTHQLPHQSILTSPFYPFLLMP